MEEREKGTLLFLDELNEWEREEPRWGGRGRYKYPQPQRSHKSRQCRSSSAAVPHCDSASLQVRHYLTRQGSKGKSEVLAVLAELLRMYV